MCPLSLRLSTCLWNSSWRKGSRSIVLGTVAVRHSYGLREPSGMFSYFRTIPAQTNGHRITTCRGKNENTVTYSVADPGRPRGHAPQFMENYAIIMELLQAIQWNVCHQITSMAFKFYKIQFRPVLRPGPSWGSLWRFPKLRSRLGTGIPPPHSLPSRRHRSLALDAFGVEAGFEKQTLEVQP